MFMFWKYCYGFDLLWKVSNRLYHDLCGYCCRSTVYSVSGFCYSEHLFRYVNYIIWNGIKAQECQDGRVVEGAAFRSQSSVAVAWAATSDISPQPNFVFLLFFWPLVATPLLPIPISLRNGWRNAPIKIFNCQYVSASYIFVNDRRDSVVRHVY